MALLKAVITVLYEANPISYGGETDPKKMAAIDLKHAAPEELIQFGKIDILIRPELDEDDEIQLRRKAELWDKLQTEKDRSY